MNYKLNFVKNTLFIAIFLISFSIINGQEKRGLINDKDSYTNIRESANVNSKIISQILEGEIFKYYGSKTSWYPVETYRGIKGFIHKSRIKEYKINIDCCFNSSFTEIFLFHKDGQIYSVCGIPLSNKNGEIFYSGMSVFNMHNKIKLLEFYEGDYQTFDFVDGNIVIKEYDYLATNQKFEADFLPYSINKVLLKNDKILIVKNAPFYKFPKLNDEQIIVKIQELKETKIEEKKYHKAINIALALALNNYSIGEKFLYNLQKELNIAFDGEYGEKYNKNILIYELNRKYK